MAVQIFGQDGDIPQGHNYLRVSPEGALYITAIDTRLATVSSTLDNYIDYVSGEVASNDAEIAYISGEVATLIAADYGDEIDYLSGQIDYTNIKKAWWGTFKESFDAREISDGATVTMYLSGKDGGDLTMQFSDGDSTLDCTPPAEITLTPGTSGVPQANYIYIPQSTKVLTKSTTDWPSTEHIKVSYFFCPDAATVQTDGGCYINQNWNDELSDSNNMGHITHIGQWIRRKGATWFSGVDGAGASDWITVDTNAGVPDDIWFKSAAGVLSQMHLHTFAAQDTETGSYIHVLNHPTQPYKQISNLNSELTDSAGGSMSSNNTWFNFTFFGVANKGGQYSPILMNLPGGSYSSEADAINDVDNYNNDTLPREYTKDSSTGFPICRVTFRYRTANGGTWDVVNSVDLRDSSGLGGSGTGGSTTEFNDAQFTIFNNTDNTKIIDVDASAISTGNTRTITMADADVDLADIATNASNISTNSTNISLNDADISYVSGAVDTNTGLIGTNTTAISNNTVSIGNNTLAIQANDADISYISGEVASNDTDIASNLAAIQANDLELAYISGEVASNDSDIASNLAAIQANDLELAYISGEVASNDTDIANNTTNIGLNDLDITYLSGQIDAIDTVKYDSVWTTVNSNSGTWGGGSEALSGLTDVTISSPADAEVLTYNGAGFWENAAVPGLSGLISYQTSDGPSAGAWANVGVGFSLTITETGLYALDFNGNLRANNGATCAIRFRWHDGTSEIGGTFNYIWDNNAAKPESTIWVASMTDIIEVSSTPYTINLQQQGSGEYLWYSVGTSVGSIRAVKIRS